MECRILDYNYFFQDSVSLSSSSSNSEFPVSNLSKTIRSKVWRSSGNFVINSTNNKINFKISGGGSELTATVASATYTPSTLAAAIVTALSAQDGSNTYTVSYSSTTGKWTITTSGAFLSLLFSSGTNTATSIHSAIGFASSDHTSAVTYTGSTIAIHTEEWIVLDLLTTEEIDSFFLFFDSMRGNPFSSNAVLTLQGNATDSWASPSVSVTLTLDTTFDAASYMWGSSQSHRYWRLKIVDPKNTNLHVEIAKLVIGKATQLARIPRNGFEYSIDDQTKIERTPYGHEYADLYPQKKRLEFDYGSLSYVNVKALEAIYRRVGTATPIVFSHDSTESLFDKDHFLIYGTFKDPRFKHVIGSVFDHQISIQEVF